MLRSSYAMRTSVRYASGIRSPRLGLYETQSPVGIGATCAHAASSSTPSMFGGVAVRTTGYAAGTWAYAPLPSPRARSAVAMISLVKPYEGTRFSRGDVAPGHKNQVFTIG